MTKAKTNRVKRSQKPVGNIIELQEFQPDSHYDSGYRQKRKYVKNIAPRNDTQKLLMDALDNEGIVFAIGPAGTGKTYIAVSKAIEALQKGKVSKIVLTRPAVEAGESIGFLPGDAKEKLSPYLKPLYDILSERIGPQALKSLIETEDSMGLQMKYSDGSIEICPVGHMRGRTLKNSFIVVDEVQNCTYTQLKMLITRFGEGSTMVLTGDPSQSDIENTRERDKTDLSYMIEKLKEVPEIPVVTFENKDVVRHYLVQRIVEALG